MSTILAIETSADLASVALLCGEQLTTRESPGLHTHSQTLLPLAQNLLNESGIALAQCDAIAFGCGPGSFTGVRTACGVAQGLAFGLSLPVVPVSTLQAMAQACRAQSATLDVMDVVTVLDARMGEVYWAQYRYGGGWRTVIEPTLSIPSAVAPQGPAVWCGNGMRVYADGFADSKCVAAVRPEIMPHAGSVAQLAVIALSQGLAISARDAQPLYLRNKVALTTEERKQKAGLAVS